MKYEIKNRWTGAVIFTAEIEAADGTSPRIKLGLAVRLALKERADLREADLSGADLREADLRCAHLRGADLRGADLREADLRCVHLRGAYLSEADLRSADLSGAYLRGAHLREADLSGAHLSGADLREADLRCVHLSGAYLSGADLRGAYLRGAGLSGADLSEADLRGAGLSGADLSEAGKLPHFQICPTEGAFIGWKKAGCVVLKLEIPADAKRTSSLIGRKCRAEFVRTLCAFDSPNTEFRSGRGGVYRVGEITRPDSYDDDPRVECSHGIHFFMTRAEAEEWM